MIYSSYIGSLQEILVPWESWDSVDAKNGQTFAKPIRKTGDTSVNVERRRSAGVKLWSKRWYPFVKAIWLLALPEYVWPRSLRAHNYGTECMDWHIKPVESPKSEMHDDQQRRSSDESLCLNAWILTMPPSVLPPPVASAPFGGIRPSPHEPQKSPIKYWGALRGKYGKVVLWWGSGLRATDGGTLIRREHEHLGICASIHKCHILCQFVDGLFPDVFSYCPLLRTEGSQWIQSRGL